MDKPVFLVSLSERQQRPKRNLQWSGLTVLIRVVCCSINQPRLGSFSKNHCMCRRLSETTILCWNAIQIHCWRVYKSTTTTEKVSFERRHNFTNSICGWNVGISSIQTAAEGERWESKKEPATNKRINGWPRSDHHAYGTS